MSATEQATTNTALEQPGPSNTTESPEQIRPLPSRAQTGPAISLIDRTSSYSPSNALEEHEDPEPPSPGEGLNRKWTKQSLQQSLAHRKYARYQEDRLFVPENPAGESASEDDQSRMQWGKKKVKGLLKTKRQFQLAKQEDAAIDVLWENQRGWWAFGVPHFSSKSLLNFDPKPWLNGHRKPSPVNITNAQVPDPDWEWTWKSWYVDMSRDVDEEGWEYSFAFSSGFAWHGNHPWGHSWVRRRRWLRKRVRKHIHHVEGRSVGQGHMTDAHHLNADYFTIHSSNDLSRTNSAVPSTLMSKIQARKKEEEEYNEDALDVRDIGTLLAHLKRAAVDREKIVLVRRFVETAGEDVYYLEEQVCMYENVWMKTWSNQPLQMPAIMSLCVFQNSRRQLLSMLMKKCEAASHHRKEHEKEGRAEGPLEKRQTDNLVRAISAADEQVKKLEYWSDQRRLVSEGIAGKAPDDDRGWDHRWQGIDNSGPGSNVRTTAKEKGRTIEDVVHEDGNILSGDSDEGGSDETEIYSAVEQGTEIHQEGHAEDETVKSGTEIQQDTGEETNRQDYERQHEGNAEEKMELLSEDEGVFSPNETYKDYSRLADRTREVDKGSGRAAH